MNIHSATACQDDTAQTVWMATRGESYATVLARRNATNLIVPELVGIAGLLFGVGVGGEGWLARLAVSDWFSGFVPRPEDLGPGEEASGRWSLPPEAAGARTADVLASASLPAVYWAAVAVSREAGPLERSVALELVGALRKRRDPGDGMLPVIVTLEGSPSQDEVFVRSLLDLGAFVVEPAKDVGGDYLHHLPLRALISEPRLICIDLVDTLLAWQSGRRAVLHRIPADADQAVQALGLVPVPPGGAHAIDLRFHYDLHRLPDHVLSDMERVITQCGERLLRPDGDSLLSTASRLDGRTGTADLLVIH